MTETFGLVRKIENYNGSHPITLYRWDLECLMDVIDQALKDERDYPDQSSAGYLALKRLGERRAQHQEARTPRPRNAQGGNGFVPQKAEPLL